MFLESIEMLYLLSLVLVYNLSKAMGLTGVILSDFCVTEWSKNCTEI